MTIGITIFRVRNVFAASSSLQTKFLMSSKSWRCVALCASPIHCELKFDEDRASGTCFQAPVTETKVVECTSSSIIGLVVEYPPVSFVALVSFVTLVHLLSLCNRVGLSVGGVVGSIRLLRRPLPLVSIFQFSSHASSLSTAAQVSDLDVSTSTWHWHVSSDRSVVSLCTSSACLNVDTLSLHFSFISTGSGVPIPGCFLSFHHLSTDRSPCLRGLRC